MSYIKTKDSFTLINERMEKIKNIESIELETPYYGKEKAFIIYKSGKRKRISVNQYKEIISRKRLAN